MEWVTVANPVATTASPTQRSRPFTFLRFAGLEGLALGFVAGFRGFAAFFAGLRIGFFFGLVTGLVLGFLGALRAGFVLRAGFAFRAGFAGFLGLAGFGGLEGLLGLTGFLFGAAGFAGFFLGAGFGGDFFFVGAALRVRLTSGSESGARSEPLATRERLEATVELRAFFFSMVGVGV